MYDLIILGGGPAGLTAMIYAIRKHLNALLISRDLGGKTNYHLSLPWINDIGGLEGKIIQGLEIVNKFRSELEYLEFARHMEAAEKVELIEGGFRTTTRGGAELDSKALLVATGSRQAFLDVPGERLYMMYGLCYSALSYAPLFLDRAAVVVGEGELALRSTAELATMAKKVTLICECKSHAAMESPLGKKVLSSPNVEILHGYQVLEVHGTADTPAPGKEHGFAREMLLQDQEGNKRTLEADGFFIERALIANTKMVAGLVETDGFGHIRVDNANRTNVPGIFAAGDATSGFAEQVLIAVGDGAKAALSAYEYLLGL